MSSGKISQVIGPVVDVDAFLAIATGGGRSGLAVALATARYQRTGGDDCTQHSQLHRVLPMT